MNLRKWIKRTKYSIGSMSVGLWGINKSHKGLNHYLFGTGFLFFHRGLPFVITCDHVIRNMDDPIYCTMGLETYQEKSLFKAPIYFSDLDAALLPIKDLYDFNHKNFLDYKNCIFQDVEMGESLLNYGFPNGSKKRKFRTGVHFNESERLVTMNSVTYVSEKENDRYNLSLRRKQPTIRWVPEENMDFKEFQSIGNFDPRGFSGGPVFISNSLKLVGYITHCDLKRSLYYISIDDLLRKMDKHLNPIIVRD